MATPVGVNNQPAPPWYAQSSESDPEALKRTIKDGNTSPDQFSYAIGRLQELYGVKTHKGTATDDEKKQFEMLNSLLTGSISDQDTQQLASILGVSQEKLTEVKKRFSPDDGNGVL